MRVLLIEDDADLRASLASVLRTVGYAVDEAGDGPEGLYFGEDFPLDLAIVDVGLPGMSGLDVIRKLRSKGKVFPILVLTARSDWQDKVEGLEAGADDYLTKPFHAEELKARVAALLRRSAGHASPEVRMGPYVLDLSAQRLLRADATAEDNEVSLTTFEYRVLEYLALHEGELVTKTELTEHIYEEDADRDSNVIEVFIGRLRRKLDPDGSLKPIETLRGRGYRLNFPAHQAR